MENFGFYVVALAYFALISSVADFGFNRFVVREGAKNLNRLSILVGGSILVRFLLTLLFLGIFALWLYFFDHDLVRVNLSLLAALAVLPQSVALTFDAALVAKQQLRLSSLALLGLSVSTTFLGVYLVGSGLGVYGAVVALGLGQVVYVGVLVLLLFKRQINLFSKVSLPMIKEVLKGSLPYGILGVLGLLYFRIDTLLLSYLKGAEQTGFYGAAYKFLEAIVFVPSAISSAMFPVLAKLHDDNIQGVKKLYFSSLKFLGVFSLPILLGYIFILPFVIRWLLPDYLPAVGAVWILSLAIPFMFIHVPGAIVLLSTDKFLKPVIVLSLIMLTFNILLNLILIPNYGFIGSSWATVLSEIGSFVVFFVFLQRRVFR